MSGARKNQLSLAALPYGKGMSSVLLKRFRAGSWVAYSLSPSIGRRSEVIWNMDTVVAVRMSNQLILSMAKLNIPPTQKTVTLSQPGGAGACCAKLS
jgi:hypothetical protein